MWRVCRSGGENSRAKTFAAGTGGGGVGVGDFEAATLEGIGVIEFGTSDVEGAFGIDHDADAGGFDENVAIGGGILEVHFVLEAGAAAADNRDAEDALRPALALQERGNFLSGG